MNARWRDLTLIVAPDNTAFLKGGDGKFPTFGQLYVYAQQRQVLRPMGRNVELKIVSTGSWSGDNPDYKISMTPGGKNDSECKLKGGFLNFVQSGNTCVFYKLTSEPDIQVSWKKAVPIRNRLFISKHCEKFYFGDTPEFVTDARCTFGPSCGPNTPAGGDVRL